MGIVYTQPPLLSRKTAKHAASAAVDCNFPPTSFPILLLPERLARGGKYPTQFEARRLELLVPAGYVCSTPHAACCRFHTHSRAPYHRTRDLAAHTNVTQTVSHFKIHDSFFPQGDPLKHGNGVIFTNQSLVLQSIGRRRSGAYSCQAVNAVGKGSSQEIKLNVKCKNIGKDSRETSVTCDLCSWTNADVRRYWFRTA